MTADLTLLVDRVRAEVVGRGFLPRPVFDRSATETVQLMWGQGAADTYIVQRLTHVLRQLTQLVQPSGAVDDALIALGEVETFLALRRREAA